MNFKTQTTENKVHYSKLACIVFLFSVVSTLVLAENQNRQTLKTGLEAVNQGNIKKAIRIFQQAIRENPRDQYAYYYLNKSYQEIGNLAKALEACQNALKINPNFAQAYNDLGSIAHQQGNLADATHAYRKSIELEPSVALYHYNLGTVYHTLGRLTNAIAEYHTTLDLDHSFTPAYHNLGAVYQKQGKVHEAIEIYEKALHYEPEQIHTQKSLAEVEVDRVKLFNQVILRSQTAISMQPDSADNYRKLGLAYYHSGHWNQAIEMLKIALQLEPNSAKRQADLSKVKLQLDRHLNQELETCYKSPQNAEIYHRIGQIQLMKGEFQNAEHSFRQSLKLLSNNTIVHLSLGETLYKQNKLEDANEAYSKVITQQPANMEAHQKLGVIAQRSKHWDRAIKHLEISNSLDPNNPLTHHYLGLAYHGKGNLAQAITAYQMSIRFKPDLVTAYSDLGDAYTEIGKSEIGHMFYQKFINLAKYHQDLKGSVEKTRSKVLELEY